MSGWVLDSSALLSIALKEAGADQVLARLCDTLMSTVNYAETLTVLWDRGVAVDQAVKDLKRLPIEIVPFDATQAALAAELRGPGRALGLSLGDRACLALAQATRRTAVTADRAWTRLKCDIAVECIR